jgi:hypothetical protein
MYAELCTFATLHKTTCCIGPGLCELPRIPIPRTSVNKGKGKGRASYREPGPQLKPVPYPLLANRWVGAPVRSAVPECVLGEVHGAHHLTVLDAPKPTGRLEVPDEVEDDDEPEAPDFSHLAS